MTQRQWDRLCLPFDLLRWGLGFLWTWACIVAALVMLAVTRSRRLPLAMARRIWAPGMLALAGARLEVSGRERLRLDRPAVYAASHESWMDVPAIFAALPVPIAFILKKELRSLPLVGWYAQAMGMIFVDRADRRGARKSVDAAAETLARGRNVVIFPAGTRSRDGALGHFKSGGFAAPLAAGVDVVPVAIIGAGWVMPPHSAAIRRGTIRVAFGSPIATAGRPQGDRAALAAETEAAVAALVSFDLPAGALLRSRPHGDG